MGQKPRDGKAPFFAGFANTGLHQARRAGKHIIAGQNRCAGRPVGVERWISASKERVINEVIVNQGCRVQHLNRRRQRNRFIRIGIAKPVCQQADSRSKSFSSGINQIVDCFCQ